MNAITRSHEEIRIFFSRNRPTTPACSCKNRACQWFEVWGNATGLIGIYLRKELTDKGIRTRITPSGKLLAWGRCAKLQRITGQWLKAVKAANEL